MELKNHHDRDGRVSASWGRWAAVRDDRDFMQGIAWAEYPLIERYINYRVSGDEEVDWLEWAMNSYFPHTAKLGLSLGCGSGNLERRILDMGMARRMEGVDISEHALDLARERAQDRPVEYSRVDLNGDPLKPGRYDFVISAAVLHHVTNLEHCLAQVHRSLKEDGLLLMYEFVGPDRFQWTEEQLVLMNRAYEILPEEHCFNRLSGLTHDAIERRPLNNMIEADPSEAVRSSEILEIASWFFETLEIREVGGTILHPLLEGIVGNFDESDYRDRALLNMLVALECSQIEEGCLPADFLVMVGRKKEGKLTPEEAKRMGDEKVDVITRQEEEILELNRRLEEADERNQELRAIADAHLGELEELKLQNRRLLEENAALKSGGPLRLFRFVRAKFGRLKGG